MPVRSSAFIKGEKSEVTKKEISRRKEASRKRRKSNASARKDTKPDKERTNPVSVTFTSEGTAVFKGRSLNPVADKNQALKPFNKQLLIRGLQIRLLPTDAQAELIRRTNGCARFVRNDYLSRRIAQFENDRTTLSVSEYKKSFLKQLKIENPWLCEVDKFALEAAVEHVDDAYRHFFAGDADFPKFVSKFKPNGNRYTTKFTNSNIELLEIEDNLFLKLPKIGNVLVALPKKTEIKELVKNDARITKATVILDGNNYLASLALEAVIDIVESIKQFGRNQILAMDMGIRKFCDYGHGNGIYNHIENPRWIDRHAKRLRRLQKSLSRKQYDQKTHTGSANWKKAKQKVAKEQRKIANQRKDFHHKLSRIIANSCDVFICEDLNIRNMIRNRHLSKQIASAGWGRFLGFVKYKLESRGGVFHKVNRWFPSSKTCHHCGHVKKDLKDQLFWRCPHCGMQNERDDTAVENLINEGIRNLKENGYQFIDAA